MNPNKPFVFNYFGLNQDRGMIIHAITMAHLLQNCMSPINIAQGDVAIRHFKSVVIPSLKKGDKWTQEEITERDYMWLLVGVILNEGDNNPEFWPWALQFKKDTYEDTLLNVLDDTKGYIGECLSPLN